MELLSLALSAVVVLVVDQATKRAVARRLGAGQVWRGTARLAIRRVDTGAARPAGAARWRWLALWLAVLTGTVLHVHLVASPPALAARLTVGAALGGATGNLLDRLRHGRIIDFIAIGPWPVFNVADAGITCGALTALWLML